MTSRIDPSKSSLYNMMEPNALYDFVRDRLNATEAENVPRYLADTEYSAFWNIIVLRRYELPEKNNTKQILRNMTYMQTHNRRRICKGHSALARGLFVFFMSGADRVLTPHLAALIAVGVYQQYQMPGLVLKRRSDDSYIITSTVEFEEKYDRRAEVEISAEDLALCLNDGLLEPYKDQEE